MRALGEGAAPYPAYPRASAPDAPLPPGAPLLDAQERRLAVLAMGVVGGGAIAWWAFEHMFVVGLEAKERKQFLAAGAVGLTIVACAYLFHIDKKWWDIEAGAEAAEEAYRRWQGLP